MSMKEELAEYEVKIVGTAPMIMNRLSKDLIDEMANVPKGKKEAWEEENWEKKLYTEEVDGKRVIAWPAINIHSFLVNSCMKFRGKSPPKEIGRTWTDYCKSSILVKSSAVIMGSKPEKFGCLVNGNPSVKSKSSKVWRCRPIIREWSTTLHFADFAGYFSQGLVEELVTHAGKFIGLSDWRPVFGRFKVMGVKRTVL